MLAALPMTTASSRTPRSALASARSVFSWSSEDVAAILPAGDEDRAARWRQQQAAHDHPQIARVDVRQGATPPRAGPPPPAREQLRVARTASTRAVLARGRGLGGAPAAAALAAHLPRIHRTIITQAFGFCSCLFGKMPPARARCLDVDSADEGRGAADLLARAADEVPALRRRPHLPPLVDIH